MPCGSGAASRQTVGKARRRGEFLQRFAAQEPETAELIGRAIDRAVDAEEQLRRERRDSTVPSRLFSATSLRQQERERRKRAGAR